MAFPSKYDLRRFFRFSRIDWETVGKVLGYLGLLFLEYSFKIVATVAGFIVLGSGGAFTEKLKTGFTSLTQGLRYVAEAPGNIFEMAVTIHDYNTLTPSQFNFQYGTSGIDDLMWNINIGIEYLLDIYRNLVNQPLTTITAGMLVFCTFWILARVLKFARQKGQGSRLVRFERKLGNKIFKLDTMTSDGEQELNSSQSNSGLNSSRSKKGRISHGSRRKHKLRSGDNSPFPVSSNSNGSSASGSGIQKKRPTAVPTFTQNKKGYSTSLKSPKSVSPLTYLEKGKIGDGDIRKGEKVDSQKESVEELNNVERSLEKELNNSNKDGIKTEVSSGNGVDKNTLKGPNGGNGINGSSKDQSGIGEKNHSGTKAKTKANVKSLKSALNAARSS